MALYQDLGRRKVLTTIAGVNVLNAACRKPAIKPAPPLVQADSVISLGIGRRRFDYLVNRAGFTTSVSSGVDAQMGREVTSGSLHEAYLLNQNQAVGPVAVTGFFINTNVFRQEITPNTKGYTLVLPDRDFDIRPSGKRSLVDGIIWLFDSQAVGIVAEPFLLEGIYTPNSHPPMEFDHKRKLLTIRGVRRWDELDGQPGELINYGDPVPYHLDVKGTKLYVGFLYHKFLNP